MIIIHIHGLSGVFTQSKFERVREEILDTICRKVLELPIPLALGGGVKTSFVRVFESEKNFSELWFVCDVYSHYAISNKRKKELYDKLVLTVAGELQKIWPYVSITGVARGFDATSSGFFPAPRT